MKTDCLHFSGGLGGSEASGFGLGRLKMSDAAFNHCDLSPEGSEDKFIAITESESLLKQDQQETMGAVARRVGHFALHLPRWKGVPRHRPDAGIGLMKNALGQ